MTDRASPFTVRLDEETRRLIRHLAKIEERGVGTIIRRAIRAYLHNEYPDGVPTEAA